MIPDRAGVSRHSGSARTIFRNEAPPLLSRRWPMTILLFFTAVQVKERRLTSIDNDARNEKAREARLRRIAARQDFRLSKSRRYPYPGICVDPLYWLIDTYT